MFENTENLARKLLQIQDNKYGKIGDLQLQKLFLTYCDLRKKEFLLQQWSKYCFTCEKQNSLEHEDQLNSHLINRGCSFAFMQSRSCLTIRNPSQGGRWHDPELGP